ncbi:hypothetical protein BLNAU_8606 [Blattamonas nauphoetae]|uniref:Integrase n=1 Tax=Blattamonas nauphoetae TaxID=2049346 RepID=A0ABQ9XY30_9EUKA|nr:hypothetical protein BLNAU_8606 [Blattamonas nauphoetae]
MRPVLKRTCVFDDLEDSTSEEKVEIERITTLFQMDLEVLTDFIWILGTEVHLATHSLKVTVKYTLLSLETIHTGAYSSQETISALKNAISVVILANGLPDKIVGKPPILVGDLKLILDHFPDQQPEKWFEASLFLFALSTGARASTCGEIRLKDVERVVCLENSTVLLVTLRLRKMKGYCNEDTLVTVDGCPFTKSNLNVKCEREGYEKNQRV